MRASLSKFLVAPLIGNALLGALFGFLTAKGDSLWTPGPIFAVVVFGSLVAVPTSLFVAYPLFRFFNRRYKLWLPHILFTSTGCGALVGLLFSYLALMQGSELKSAIWWVTTCSSGGILSGISFWLLSRQPTSNEKN